MQELLADLARCGPINTVLEIGTFQGDSLRIWRAALNPSLMIGVQDTNETDPKLAEFLGVQMVIGKSQGLDIAMEVVHILGGAPVDFLYIDGDHHYREAMRDWILYAPLVRRGGIIVLHDAVIEDNDTVEIFSLYRDLREGRRSKLLFDGTGANTGAAVFFV